MQYRGAAPGALRIAHLDALSVIYDRRSGQTHVVVADVVDIVESVSDDTDLASVLARLSIENNDENRVLLVQRLDELAQAGLIEPL